MFSRKKKVEEMLRRHYRRKPGKQHGISIGVVGSDGKRFNGTILDLSAGGAALSFGEYIQPPIEIGDEVDVHFTVISRRAEFTVRARALWITGSERTVIAFGFQFLQGGEQLEELESYFRNFFNRRKHPRIRPALGKAIAITVDDGDVEFTGELRNLSMGGAVFLITGGDPPAFVQDAAITVSVAIPDKGNPVTTEATVRHSKPVSKGLLLGLVFNPSVIKKFKKDRDRLDAYIESRLLEIERYNAA